MPLKNKSSRKIHYHQKQLESQRSREVSRTPEQIKEENIKKIMQEQKRKRQNAKFRKLSKQYTPNGSKPSKSILKNQKTLKSQVSNRKKGSLSKSRLEKPRKKVHLGRGVPLREREVEEAQPWKHSKLAKKIRKEDFERRRKELFDFEKEKFNQKIELSEASHKHSQSKLRSLIYKD